MNKKVVKSGEVFLSHAALDGDVASKIAEDLRAKGLRVWFSSTHLAGGHDWHREIGRALKRCQWFVVLLSPASVRSMWVERELNYALRQRRYRGRIIPVVLRACNVQRLSWTLPQFQMIKVSARRGVTSAAIARRCI